MEKDNNLSFVQTPQFYSNIEESRVARAAAFQQVVFYEYICEGKSINDSMFCCGTNVVFRVDALKSVGGLDESTVTEDFATSVKLHAGKWKSLYYNHVCAFGMGPVTLDGYFKQQFRWANGTISVFRKVLFRLVTRPFSLTLGQWWEYFLSSSYYLIGSAFFLMMICPVIYLLFGIPSFFLRKEIYFLSFLPYIILSMSVFYLVLKGRNYKVKDLFLGQFLSVATITVYMRAAACALLGVKGTFKITGKEKEKAVSYFRLWPQLSLWMINFVAIIWGLNRFIYEREAAILVNSFWAMYHFIVLGAVFYFNQPNE
jgi:cellulose synthase (UDP-forming)